MWSVIVITHVYCGAGYLLFNYLPAHCVLCDSDKKRVSATECKSGPVVIQLNNSTVKDIQINDLEYIFGQ